MKKLLSGLIGLMGLVLLWQLLATLGGYSTALFPSPFQVVKGFVELLTSGTLITHIRVSMARFLMGYITAAVCGIVLGLILGWYHKAWNFFNPIVQILRPISPIAWIPFIVLWFGIGDLPAVLIIFIAGFYPVLLATVAAVSRVDNMYIKVAQNFALTKSEMLIKIILPASFPQIATGLHQALGSAWVFLVAGEMVGAQTGLGYLIIDARNSLRPDLLLAAMFTIGFLGLILDALMKFIEKSIDKNWGNRERNGE